MAKGLSKALVVWGVLAALACALSAVQIWRVLHDVGSPGVPIGDSLRWTILANSTLPRAAVAILTGATLALSGLVLQRVLRNPLAEPSTLGIFSGANLAMALAALYAPWLLSGGREGVAFAGGLAAMIIVLSLTWRRGLEPVSLVLAGMMVSLTAASLSAALVLANGEYLYTLFIWGGGSLVQTGWTASVTLLAQLIAAALVVITLLRPLSILGLDDQGARSLGISPALWRCGAVVLAIALATTVASQVGVIGFVGLAAPALANLSGARTFPKKVIAAPLIGAIVLWLTDGLVQLSATGFGEWMPTGAATAFLGGPLLLWMLLRVRIYEWRTLAAGPSASHRIANPALFLSLGALGLIVIAAISVMIGRGPDGLHVATGPLLADLAGWRLPRIAVAAAAGAMLGAAGMILQRVTGNPLASPEMLGISSASGVGLAAALTLSPTAGLTEQYIGLASGALIAIAIILKLANTKQIGPERLLLAGVAIGAMANALVTAVVASGDQRAFSLLRWLSGTTHDTQPNDAWIAALGAAMLIAPVFFAVRWLTALPLGSAISTGIGLEVRRVRVILIVMAGFLSAGGSLLIGPLSLIGLIAPHLTRAIGLVTASAHLAGSILIGAGLLVLADWLSRSVAFPYELPLSLFASLIAGPYLVYLLSRGVRSRA